LECGGSAPLLRAHVNDLKQPGNDRGEKHHRESCPEIAENITVPKAIRRPQPGQVAACFDT
jgi:hypothetical protein